MDDPHAWKWGVGYYKFVGEDMTSKELVNMFMFSVSNKKVQCVIKIVFSLQQSVYWSSS